MLRTILFEVAFLQFLPPEKLRSRRYRSSHRIKLFLGIVVGKLGQLNPFFPQLSDFHGIVAEVEMDDELFVAALAQRILGQIARAEKSINKQTN